MNRYFSNKENLFPNWWNISIKFEKIISPNTLYKSTISQIWKCVALLIKILFFFSKPICKNVKNRNWCVWSYVGVEHNGHYMLNKIPPKPLITCKRIKRFNAKKNIFLLFFLTPWLKKRKCDFILFKNYILIIYWLYTKIGIGAHVRSNLCYMICLRRLS